MTLIKLDDYFPNYHAEADGYDITNFEVIAKGNQKVGSVETVLVDEERNRFRYFVIDMGLWILGQKILLPIGLGLIVDVDRSVYVEKFTKEQMQDSPKYERTLLGDRNYEVQVQSYYRHLLETLNENQHYTTEDYQQYPDFYEIKNPKVKQYEEQLSSKKKRQNR